MDILDRNMDELDMDFDTFRRIQREIARLACTSLKDKIVLTQTEEK